MSCATVQVARALRGTRDGLASALDVRWKCAAGRLGFDYLGCVHIVLVDMWAWLARSERSNRIFETAWYTARRMFGGGGAGRSRLLGLLTAVDVAEVRAMLAREDNYRTAGKRVRDHDDPADRHVPGSGRTGRHRS